VIESAATPEARHQILMPAGRSTVIPHDPSLYIEKGGLIAVARRMRAYDCFADAKEMIGLRLAVLAVITPPRSF
jgi:hypothetical protein